MFKFIATYLLGAFTFWPSVGLLVYYGLQKYQSKVVTGLAKRPQFKHYKPPACLINEEVVDRDSAVLFKGTIRLAPIPAIEPSYESSDSSSDSEEEETATAKSTLQKITKLFRSDKDKDGPTEPPKKKAHKISHYPSYYAVLRGGQLQLYEDEKSSKQEPKIIIVVPQYIVSLWPQGLREFELFYRRYPIVLAHKIDSDGYKSLESNPEIPPKAAHFIYCDNTCIKEDLYFALIKESKINLSGYKINADADANFTAVPLIAKHEEMHELQNNIWNKGLLKDTQWLNGILGRLFLGVKDSEHTYEYLETKFTSKLKAISSTSNLVGKIEVKNICTGTAAPLITEVQLKEFSPDGKLVVSAEVNYSGGFRVHLATSVRLSAVTSITSVEIPVELVAILKSFKGTILCMIKPPPSDRIWYGFETMPEVDLDIEPAVYDTQISLSVVTKFIKSRILDSFKESMVYPFMDDISFYDTADKFYRGGIWSAPQIAPTESMLGEPFDETESSVSKETQRKARTSPKRKPVTVYESPGYAASSASGKDSNKNVPEMQIPSFAASTALYGSHLSDDDGGKEGKAEQGTQSSPHLNSSAISVKSSKSSNSPQKFSPNAPNYTSPLQVVNRSPVSPQIRIGDSSTTALSSSPSGSLYPRSNKPASVLTNRSPKLEVNLPKVTTAIPSTEMSSLSASGEISIEPQSVRARRFSELSDNRSISSRNSAGSKPAIPPRNRKFVSLANVPPETHLDK